MTMKITLLIFLLGMALQIASQKSFLLKKTPKDSSMKMERVQREARANVLAETFQELEEAIARRSLGTISQHLAPQVYVSISGGESGYLSSNQALSILQNYFSQHKPLSFSFSRSSETQPTPYATGRMVFLYGGNRESAQIYVSLARQDSGWVVNQFNIY